MTMQRANGPSALGFACPNPPHNQYHPSGLMNRMVQEQPQVRVASYAQKAALTDHRQGKTRPKQKHRAPKGHR